MMTSDEYRIKAAAAHDRASTLRDTEWRAMLIEHADLWTRLAADSDYQDAVGINLEIERARNDE